MNIDEGNTLDYLIPAFFILLLTPITLYIDFYQEGLFIHHLGTFGAVIVYTVLLISFTVGITLLLVKSGIQIDSEHKRIRVYKSFNKYRIGNWIDFSELNSIKLEFTNDSIHLMSRGMEKTYRTKTYDLYLETTPGKFELLHCFDKKGLATKTVSTILDLKKVPYSDNTKKKTSPN